MTKHVLLALTNPIVGREDDYDRWFEDTHVPEMLAVPGFLSAQRFEVASDQVLPGDLPYRFITAYEVETNELAESLAQFGQAARAGSPTDSSDTSRRALWVYTPKGEKQSRAG